MRHVLVANETLSSFTEGRIRRAVLMALPKGMPSSTILVCAGLPRLANPGIGACTDLIVPVQVGVCWEQPLSLLDDDDLTASAIFAEIVRSVVANPYLAVPKYGKKRLTDRLVDVRPLGPPVYQDGESSVTLMEFIEFSFEKQLDARAWDIE